MLTLNDGRTELWQWDTGRTLSVDADCSQVHFSNKVFGRSIDVDVVDGVANIPDILLQTDKDLNVWAFVGTAENGYTKISKTFKVNRRNKPADYVFTPTDQMTLQTIQRQIGDLADLTTETKDTLVAAINEAARTGGGAGMTTAQINALDGMFKVCAFIKADVSAEYTEFKTAFGITDSGGGSGGGESGGEGGEIIYYTIEKTLTNVSISNGAASVAAGSAYSATLTADEGYTLDSVTVTMGGEAVTVTDGVIEIAAVTGNIVITATATAVEPGGYEWTSGVAYDLTDKIVTDTTIDANGNAVTSTGKYCTDYLNCFDVDYLGTYGTGYPLHFYDVNKNYISRASTRNVFFYPVPENAVYFRSNLPNGDVTTGFTPITKADNNITVGVQTVTWTKGSMTETGEIGSGSMYTTNELIPVAGAIALSGSVSRIACYDAYKNFIYYKSSPTNLNNFKGYGWDAFSYVRVCGFVTSTIEVFDENAHTITKTLSNVTCSYTNSLVNDQHPLNATLTASDGYALSTVTVTMGGVDITEAAYAGGTITIDNVTGDIVITATAEAVE